MIRFLQIEKLHELPISAEARATIEHFHRVIMAKEYGPMVNPETGDIGIAEIPMPTTQNVEAVADEIRNILIYQSVTTSNPCRCAELYAGFEKLRAEIAGSIKKAERRRIELAQVDADQKKYFPGAVPTMFAQDITDKPCEYCGKHKLVPPLLAFSSPALRQKVLSLIFGGHVPFNFLVYYLSLLDKMIYNEDVIPEQKKTLVREFNQKAGVTTRLASLYQWLRGEASHSTNSAATKPKPSPSNTGTTDTTGDLGKPTWTPDLPPNNDDSTSSSGNANAA